VVKRTAGQGIEALRARISYHSLSMSSSLPSEARCYVMTTLRAPPEVFQKNETPLQNFEAFRAWLHAQGNTTLTIKENVNYASKHQMILIYGRRFNFDDCVIDYYRSLNSSNHSVYDLRL
jgi:hypothetical protein